MSRRIIILTEGHTEPHAGKTAACVIRYRGHEVVALLDAHAGRQDERRTAGRRQCADRRQAGRCAGGEHAAAGHRAAGRQDSAAVAGDHSGRHRPPQDGRDQRPARFRRRRSGVFGRGQSQRRHDPRRAEEHARKRSPAARACGPIACASTPSATIARSARWSSRSKSPTA